MSSTTTSVTVKAAVQEGLSRHRPQVLALSAQLHADPEVAFEEHRSAARVIAVLEEAGFDTVMGCYGLPTAVGARQHRNWI